jgi:hypothetical protein
LLEIGRQKNHELKRVGQKNTGKLSPNLLDKGMQQWSFQSAKNSEEREQRLLLLLMVWTVLGAHLGR